MKTCSKCKVKKTLDNFSIKKSNKDGKSNICKNCISIAKKKNYKSKIVSFTITHPELAEEFHPNNIIDIKTISASSKKKVLWQCKKNTSHVWESSLHSRTKEKNSCPYCRNRKLSPDKTNSLKYLFPNIAKDWNYIKNNIRPDEILAGSSKKVWWKCFTCSHEWQATCSNRTKNNNSCPKCNKSTLLMYTSFSKEWLIEKNGDIPPSLTINSHKKVWWKCEFGHEYDMEVRLKADKNYGCPYCSGRRVVKEKSLGHTYPEKAVYFNEEKNNISIFQVSPNSSSKYYWKCNEGHEWKLSPRDLIKKENPCSACSGKIPSSNKNLTIDFPDVKLSWNYNKNNKLPDEYLSKSNERVWWKCSNCSNEWDTYIYNRVKTNDFKKCPNCCNSSGVSKAEQEIVDYIKTIYNGPIIQNDRKQIAPKEIDIYLPDLKIGIEYHGLYWHTEDKIDKNLHREKFILAKEKGIHLIQIFSDEWQEKNDLIKSMISHRLGKTQNIIYARKTFIEEISRKEAKEFLSLNHVSSFRESKYIYGLRDKKTNELLSLITLNQRPRYKEHLEIIRFATKINTQVVGGFSKLLKFIINNFNSNFTHIFTYADLRFGEGKVYQVNKFKFLGYTEIDYWYTDGFIRESRYKYQATEDETEKEIAFKCGVSKIHGPGSAKYIRNL